MYAAYFNLSDNPFAITPDPAYLYLSPQHQEALGHLLYGTGEDGGFVQLTGEVGTGKTTVIRALLRQDMANVDIALCLNPRLTVEEFLAAICDELKIGYPQNATLKTLVDALNERLLERHSQGRRTVLIIDEAQNLSREVLEQVRLLTNLETHRHKLLRIILVGQPELQEMLARRDLRQLAQRITARYHLRPFTRREAEAYIAHRLAVAGGRAGLFTPAAIRAVVGRSQGIPRLINIICDRALLGAYSQNLQQVDAAVVRKAAREALESSLRPLETLQRFATSLWFPIGVGIAVGAVVYLSNNLRDAPAAPAPVVKTRPDVRVNAAPAVAPIAPVMPGGTDDLAGAMQRLLKVWGQGVAIRPADRPCARAESTGLRCLEAFGSIEDLRRFNLPAILQWRDADGQPRHVLLRALSAKSAVLETAAGVEKRPLSEMESSWTGDYVLLWQPAVTARSIGPGARGESVIWLRQQLELAGGQPVPAQGAPEVFDQALAIQLRHFQATHGLATDGVAGAQTLIMLGNASANAATPRLVSGG